MYGRQLTLQQRITWVKRVALNGPTLPVPLLNAMHYQQVGHFSSITSPHFLNPVTEDIWHFSPSGSRRSTAPRLVSGSATSAPINLRGLATTVNCTAVEMSGILHTMQSRADHGFRPASFPVARPSVA
jgi:hypothetical protein